MSKRAVAIVAVLWVLSLLVVKSVVSAQSYGINPLTPRVLSGPDFGVRIEGEQNGVPVGTPVIRVDGRWIDVKIWTGQTNRLSAR
jgi:hypothetical protein